MFDFDSLESVENEVAILVSPLIGASERQVMHPEMGLSSTRSDNCLFDTQLFPTQPLDTGTVAKPTSEYLPGSVIESVSASVMRQYESRKSDFVKRLLPATKAEILTVGGISGGERIQVRDASGQEGWVSMVSETGVLLWKSLGMPTGYCSHRIESRLNSSLFEERREQVKLEDALEAQIAPAQVEATEHGRRWNKTQSQRNIPICIHEDLECHERKVESSNRPNPAKDVVSVMLCVRPGDVYYSTANMLMRCGEQLTSLPLSRLPVGVRLQVLKVSGLRLLVIDEYGRQGWVSTVAANGTDLLRLARKSSSGSRLQWSLLDDRNLAPVTDDLAVLSSCQHLSETSAGSLLDGSQLQILKQGLHRVSAATTCPLSVVLKQLDWFRPTSLDEWNALTYRENIIPLSLAFAAHPIPGLISVQSVPRPLKQPMYRVVAKRYIDDIGNHSFHLMLQNLLT